LYACGGGPTAPSASIPTGCQGQPINNIYFAIGSGGSTQRFTARLFGEDFSGPPQASVIRSVVPCDYELTGRILDPSPMLITIGFADGRQEPGSGGVVADSIVLVEGPSARIDRPGQNPVNPNSRRCHVELNPTVVPVNFTIRFRVDATVPDGRRCERS
jgi:hypothetical protein